MACLHITEFLSCVVMVCTLCICLPTIVIFDITIHIVECTGVRQPRSWRIAFCCMCFLSMCLCTWWAKQHLNELNCLSHPNYVIFSTHNHSWTCPDFEYLHKIISVLPSSASRTFVINPCEYIASLVPLRLCLRGNDWPYIILHVCVQLDAIGQHFVGIAANMIEITWTLCGYIVSLSIHTQNMSVCFISYILFRCLRRYT